MKLLDIDGFASLNAILDKIQGPGLLISGRAEAYSCKRVTQDKKLARRIQDKIITSPHCAVPQEAALDEDDDFTLGSPLTVPSIGLAREASATSNLDPEISADRDSIITLVTALNVSYSDYDFTDIPTAYFTRETPTSIRSVVASSLMGTGEGLRAVGVANFEQTLWKEIDQVVGLSDAEFFSFNPPSSLSPIEASWSNFIFIVNRRPEVNKLVFLTLSGVPPDDDMLSVDDFPVSASNPVCMATAPTSPHAISSGRVSSVNSLQNLDLDAEMSQAPVCVAD